MASVYAGAYNPATNYDKAKPVNTEKVSLGVTQGKLPAIAGPHTIVVRGFIEVPDSGNYTLYRKDPGGRIVKQKVTLEAGRRYPIKITYFKGGSTALWMSQEDLRGKGDLETVTKQEGKFPWLIDENGNWTVRKDVYYQDARISFKGSPLSPTSNGGKTIGPEAGPRPCAGHVSR